MRKAKYYIGFLVILLAILAVTGCALPSFSLNIQTPDAPAPNAPVTSVTVTPTPINPAFSVPSAGTNTTTSAALPNFVSVISKVKPSVVAINTKIPALSIFGGNVTQEGAGSGWIIDSSGLIVTNNHVVEGAKSITVTLEDGRNFSADTVRIDTVTDLAVVKINAQNLPSALKVGDSSKLQVGDWVVAIGNSLGQGISATKGIVSAMGVSVSADTETLYDLIQTDAAINPGNSGGPLVNLAGEVVGINSIKVSQVGVEGMGYAISIKEALPVINDLVTNGYVIRPWMGVGLYTLDRTVVLRYRLAVDSGVLVTQVAAGSPADVADIKAGDVITAIEGKDIASVDDLTHTIHGYQVGQQISVTYYRGNNKNSTMVKLAQSPPPASS